MVLNSLGTYIDQTTDCNEHNQVSISETWCYIPMVKLLQLPYSLVQGNPILAKVIAANDRGESLISNPNIVTPLVQVAPHKMSQIQQGLDTSNDEIELLWQPPSDDGGSPILGYMVYFKKGSSGAYSELIGEISSYTDLDYKITLGLVEGETYYFKAKAQNRWGFSNDWSDEVGILVAREPEKTTGLTSQILTANGNILIGWVAPHYNGTPIIGYKVEVQSNDLSWQQVPECS